MSRAIALTHVHAALFVTNLVLNNAHYGAQAIALENFGMWRLAGLFWTAAFYTADNVALQTRYLESAHECARHADQLRQPELFK